MTVNGIAVSNTRDTWPEDGQHLVVPGITVEKLRVESAEVFRTAIDDSDFGFSGRQANKLSFVFALNGQAALTVPQFNSDEAASEIGISRAEFNEVCVDFLVGKLLRVGHTTNINKHSIVLLGVPPFEKEFTAWKPIVSRDFALRIIDVATWSISNIE